MPETEGRLFVRKSDGSMESFSTEKLARSLIGAGANRDDADDIADRVRQRVRPGITTADIADLVIEDLSGRNSAWMNNYVAWQTSHQTAPQR
jgi:transcriptional regulator NrdR family protein